MNKAAFGQCSGGTEMKWRLLSILGMTLVLFGCGPSSEQMGLKEALVRLQTASAQGVSYQDYSSLVLDARTKYQMAKSHLDNAAVLSADDAIGSAEITKELWEQTLQTYCFSACSDTVKRDLVSLGIVKDAKSFDGYLHNYGYEPEPGRIDFEFFPPRPMIGTALDITGKKLQTAISKL